MKLIIFPLLILFVISVICQLGFGGAQFTDATVDVAIDSSFVATDAGLYDSEGHMLHGALDSWSGEKGYEHVYNNQIYWQNSSNSETGVANPSGSDLTYPAWWVTEGGSLAGAVEAGNNVIGFSAWTGWGFMALIVGLIVLATVAGLRVFGTGTSDVSVSAILKGTAFLSIWAILSLLSFNVIVLIPYLGIMFYLFLTFIYVLGMVNQFGNPEGVN